MLPTAVRKRSNVCKICSVFDEETLNSITLDLLLHRKSWEEIKRIYNKKLPDDVKPLSDINLNNHKKHSDPAVLADKIMESKGEPVTDSQIITSLFAERYKQEIDKKHVLKEIYRERLSNLYILQEQLNSKQKEAETSKTRSLQTEIRILIKEIDDIYDAIQQIVLKETNPNKGSGDNTTTIINITTKMEVIFQENLSKFMNEVVHSLMSEEFKNDKDRGRKVVKVIGRTLDKHIQPALEKIKLLNK